MKKIALIPTRDASKAADLATDLELAGWEVCFLTGYKSIFEAYIDGIKTNDIKPKDKVILCHDDIRILTIPSMFNLFIDQHLDNPDVGFVGVAGTKMLGESAVWWEGVGQNEYMNRLSGAVLHGTPENNHMSYYGALGEVAVLDGLFLCTTGSVLRKIQLKKPVSFVGDWDFYDLFYTAQAHRKGLKNYTASIQILHTSLGELEGRDSWHRNREAFISLFKDELPMYVINPPKMRTATS